MSIENLEVSVSCQQGVITSNLAELEENVLSIAKAYEGLEVTEENIPERKKDVATLRKVVKAIEDKRKEVKKEHMKPYTAFEAEIKAVECKIDDVINPINESIKEFEDKAKLEKLERCKELYLEHIPESLRPYIPLEAVMKDSWLNKSTADKDIIYDLSEKLTAVKTELSTLESIGIPEEIKDRVYSVYKLSGLVSAVKTVSDYKELKSTAITQATEKVAPAVNEQAITQSYELRFENEADLKTVKEYCDAMGISYR